MADDVVNFIFWIIIIVEGGLNIDIRISMIAWLEQGGMENGMDFEMARKAKAIGGTNTLFNKEWTKVAWRKFPAKER